MKPTCLTHLICLTITATLSLGCDGALRGGTGGGSDFVFAGAKDCAWLAARCQQGRKKDCERHSSNCPTSPDSGGSPSPDSGVAPSPDSGVAPSPDSGAAPSPDSGTSPSPDSTPNPTPDSGATADSATTFTTEGESHPAIRWDGIASDPKQGITSWGRLASCSRVGEPTNCSGIDRLAVVDLGVAPGKVYQAAMKSGDVYRSKARAEFAKPEKDNGDAFYIYHGDEYYIGFRSKLSVGFDSLGNGDSNSGNIMQLKGKLSCGGPALGLTIKNGRLTLRREVDGDADLDAKTLGNRDGIFWNGPLVRNLEGRWFDIVIHVKFDVDPAVGFVEIWLDGVKQNNNGATKIHGKTMCFNASEERVELKLGIYRNARYNKSTFDYHWIHEPRIGTSYAAVAPRGPRP